MPRLVFHLAPHLARTRWLITAAVIAALAWVSGFRYFSCAAVGTRCMLSSGTLLMSFATRGYPYQSHVEIGEWHPLPNWTFERGWWRSGGCTSDSLHIAMPLWIPFAGTCLMAGLVPWIPVRRSPTARLYVGPTCGLPKGQPTVTCAATPR